MIADYFIASDLPMKHIRVELTAYDTPKAALFLAALSKVCQIPAVMALINEATQAGPISIKIVPREQAIFGAQISFDREILLANNVYISEAISNLFFELCNAANPQFGKVPCSLFQDADAFATAIERVEYYSILKHAALMSQVVIHPMYKDILKMEYHQTNDRIDDVCKRLHQIHTESGQKSFDEELQRLKIKQPGQLLSHYDNHKKNFQDWEKQYRPAPKLPKASGRPLPTPPQKMKIT